MKHFLPVLIIFFSFSSFAQQRTQVLIVGTYHMSNPGADKFNLKADDVSSPRRQKEISDFIENVKKFKPTIICVEATSQQRLDSTYASYATGKKILRNNEIDQFGFRLAKMLALDKVYAIDAPGTFEIDSVVSFALENQFDDFINELGKMPEMMASEQKLLMESTVTQYMKHINSADYDRKLHQLYLRSAVVGDSENYIGADVVAEWYKRNLRIYRNIEQLPFKKEDRILVFYGSGHAKLLKDLVRDSHNFDLYSLRTLK